MYVYRIHIMKSKPSASMSCAQLNLSNMYKQVKYIVLLVGVYFMFIIYLGAVFNMMMFGFETRVYCMLLFQLPVLLLCA